MCKMMTCERNKDRPDWDSNQGPWIFSQLLNHPSNPAFKLVTCLRPPPPLINDLDHPRGSTSMVLFLTVPGVGHSTKCSGMGELMMDYKGFKMSVWSFIIISPCYSWIKWHNDTFAPRVLFLGSIISGTNVSLTTYALDEGSSSGFLYPGAFLFLI